MLLKTKLLISLGAIGIAGGIGTGIYYSLKEDNSGNIPETLPLNSLDHNSVNSVSNTIARTSIQSSSEKALQELNPKAPERKEPSSVVSSVENLNEISIQPTPEKAITSGSVASVIVEPKGDTGEGLQNSGSRVEENQEGTSRQEQETV